MRRCGGSRPQSFVQALGLPHRLGQCRGSRGLSLVPRGTRWFPAFLVIHLVYRRRSRSDQEGGVGKGQGLLDEDALQGFYFITALLIHKHAVVIILSVIDPFFSQLVQAL